MSFDLERHSKQDNSPRILAAPSSDNDANERPVREKLRETSIAPKTNFNYPSNQEFNSSEMSLPNDNVSTGGTVSVVLDFPLGIDGPRGRPGTKRSFEKIERAEIMNTKQGEDGSIGHSRKRSKDAQKLNTAAARTPSEHGDDEGLNRPDALLDECHVAGLSSAVVQPKGSAKSELTEDQEDLVLGGSTFSPRKKRSREQVDNDVQREQKIVATEEAKASRGSDEIQRTEKCSRESDISAEPHDEPFAANPSPPPTIEHAATLKEVPRQSEPRQLSTPSPQEAPLAKSTDDKTSAAEEKTAHLPASETAFSKSGLAAFSQKTTSGFGDLGSSSAVFVGRNVFSAQSSGPAGSGKQKLTDSAPVTSISSFVPQKPSAFATTSLSSSLGPSPFSASSFGSAFGIQGIFGGNSDIKNFATSNGDVASGRSKSKLSAFGAPEKEGEEDSNAGSDDEDGGASEPSDQAPTSSTKFQQKEVDTGEEGEDSIYVTGRSSLYGFADGQWRERGKGVFKLNVTSNGSDRLDSGPGHKSARFIMRAHQTHRVLLNTPIFKEMKFGDAKGEEPSNKSITFAVAEEDKLTPYTLKLSDSGEAKALYQTVKTLQVDL